VTFGRNKVSYNPLPMTEFCDIKKRYKARKRIYTDEKPAGSLRYFVIKINMSLNYVAVFYDTFILYLSFATPTLHATNWKIITLKCKKGGGGQLIDCSKTNKGNQESLVVVMT